jgi:monoamine oxidase
MRVAVVGAGFAGLAAGDALRRAGADVVVLEARDRVGGRVWSRTLPNGAVVEMGAEFVLPSYSVLLGMVRRFGLGLWAKGMRYGDREPRGGIGVDRSELLRALKVVGTRLHDADDTVSAERFLGDVDIPRGAMEAITARLEVSSANTADAVAAGDLRSQTDHLDDDCPSVAGGNQRLAFALAADLRVELRSPVSRVAWDASGVRLAAGGAEVEADACVVSIPATVVGAIAIEPALPAATIEGLSAVNYGHAAKLFVALSAPAEPSAVLSVPERYWTWTALGEGQRVQPVVSCFAGSAPALERLGVTEGPKRWIESLRRLRPDLDLVPESAVLSTWDDDPWVRAAYTATAPGGQNQDALTRPMGRLVFCGEHTAGPFAGLMEGALRSGLRAADQLLAL